MNIDGVKTGIVLDHIKAGLFRCDYSKCSI